MECAEISAHLSEYLDGALDAQTMIAVENHLQTCEECKKAFESLQSLVLELGDLDHIKAPHDFLEQLHDRMANRFLLSELIKKLFIPFKVKIPLQFATAVAMLILIFSIIHTPDIKKEIAGIPKKGGDAEGVYELGTKNDLEAKQKKDTPAPVAEIIKPVAPYPEKQLTLLPREAEPPTITSRSKKTTAQPLSQGKAYLRKPAEEKAGVEPEPSVKEVSEPVELVMVLKLKEEPASKVLSPDEVLSRIRDLINNVKGTVLSTEYDQNTHQPESIHAEIPAEQYGFLCEKLQQLGIFRFPAPAVEGKALKHLKIHIRFIHS